MQAACISSPGQQPAAALTSQSKQLKRRRRRHHINTQQTATMHAPKRVKVWTSILRIAPSSRIGPQLRIAHVSLSVSKSWNLGP